MATKKLYRQGDVLLESIRRIPEGVKKKDNILAYGEVTGHKHRFESETVQVFQDEEKTQYVEVESETDLLHEDHERISLPKGKYKVTLQREYDVVEGTRQVMD